MFIRNDETIIKIKFTYFEQLLKAGGSASFFSFLIKNLALKTYDLLEMGSNAFAQRRLRYGDRKLSYFFERNTFVIACTAFLHRKCNALNLFP